MCVCVCVHVCVCVCVCVSGLTCRTACLSRLVRRSSALRAYSCNCLRPLSLNDDEEGEEVPPATHSTSLSSRGAWPRMAGQASGQPAREHTTLLQTALSFSEEEAIIITRVLMREGKVSHSMHQRKKTPPSISVHKPVHLIKLSGYGY